MTLILKDIVTVCYIIKQRIRYQEEKKMSEIKITKDNFEEEVLKSKVPVLIDFWATWCGPCRMLAPVIEEIAKEANGRFKVGKVNVDEEVELATAFQVSSIPMLAVIKDEKVVNTAVGFMTKEKVLELLK